jgi:protease I
VGDTLCVEGRIVEVHAADTPNPRIAFFIFDPSFSDFDYHYGKFYALVHSTDWTEYFPDGAERGAFSTALDGRCARILGTIERRWGSRIRTEVRDRSQVVLIDCEDCQIPEACELPQADALTPGDRGAVLLVVSPANFNDDEYATVRGVLASAGYAVAVASRSRDTATGEYGLLEVEPDLALPEVDVTDYDAVIFIGGQGSASYRDDGDAHRVARDALKQDRILAAICTAPLILARAGVLDGRLVTVYDPAVHCPDLEAAGAICTGALVERDGLVITARSERVSDRFAQAVIDALRER